MYRRSPSTPGVSARVVVSVLLSLTVVACGDGATRVDMAHDTSPAVAAPAPSRTTLPTTTPATTGPTTDTTVARAFDIYLLTGPEDCSAVAARPRASTADDLLVDALTQLLAGPSTAEQAEGLTSWFSPATEGMLRNVVITNRVAHVSFDPALRTTIPNVSSSCGSAGFMAQLDATIIQFGTVDSIVYALGDDVAAFYEWLQALPPTA